MTAQFGLKPSVFSDTTYQQNKKNKEHVSDEVDGPEDSVRVVDGVKIKVSEDDPELGKTQGTKQTS